MAVGDGRCVLAAYTNLCVKVAWPVCKSGLACVSKWPGLCVQVAWPGSVYLQGWFLPDFISSIPVDAIIKWSSGGDDADSKTSAAGTQTKLLKVPFFKKNQMLP